MTTAPPRYIRPILIGAIAWLVCTALLRWSPVPIRFGTSLSAATLAWAFADCVLFAALFYLIARRVPVAERFPSLAAIVTPVAFGDAVSLAFFKDFFPRLNPAESGMFAAFLLLTTGVILATGLITGAARGAQTRRP
jgi:hypothetical protein